MRRCVDNGLAEVSGSALVEYKLGDHSSLTFAGIFLPYNTHPSGGTTRGAFPGNGELNLKISLMTAVYGLVSLY
jgi:hypothetical protein